MVSIIVKDHSSKIYALNLKINMLGYGKKRNCLTAFKRMCKIIEKLVMVRY